MSSLTLICISLLAALCGVACGSGPKPAPEPVAVTTAPEVAASEPPPAAPAPAAPMPAEAAPAPAAPAAAAPEHHGHDHTPGKKAAAKPAANAYTGPDPCTVAVGGSGIIDKACAKGGIKEAKLVMKSMVKKAKKGGMKVDCDSCHKDEKDWSKFTDDSKERFKDLLAVYNK